MSLSSILNIPSLLQKQSMEAQRMTDISPPVKCPGTEAQEKIAPGIIRAIWIDLTHFSSAFPASLTFWHSGAQRLASMASNPLVTVPILELGAKRG